MAKGKHRQGTSRRRNVLLIIILCSAAALMLMAGWFLLGEDSFALPQGRLSGEAVQIAHLAVANVTSLPLPTPEPTPAPTPQPAPTPRGIQQIRIRAVGDLMAHEKQLEGAYDGESYDFTGSFHSITPLLRSADMVIGNLETTIARENFTGFPLFRTPISYIDALSRAGFSVLTLANNHMWDGKMEGLENTLAALEEYGIESTGAYAIQEDSQRILLCDVQDVRVAVIAHTLLRNREFSPNWLVDYAANVEPVVEDIRRAREMGADIVLVMIHWGSEGTTNVGSSQLRAARTLAQAGADAVLGAHPHVLQPAQWLTVEDENGRERRCFVAYSMGNFLSNQRYNDPPHDAGVIFDLVVEKDLDQGTSQLSAVSCIPTWVRRYAEKSKYVYDIVPVEKTLAEGEGYTDSEIRRLNRIWKFATEVLHGVPTLYE